MERITARRALELLTDVVDRAGDDFVYQKLDMSDVQGEEDMLPNEGCRYAVDDRPSCLVGHVLHRSGVEMDVLNRLDVAGTSASGLADFGLEVDWDAGEVLVAAQALQDRGECWGDALAAARRKYEMIMNQDGTHGPE